MKNNYKIDFELLRKVKERGFCLCEIEKDNTNFCPCEDFLVNKECKCGVFEKMKGSEND